MTREEFTQRTGMDEELYKSAIDIIGRNECIKYKLNNNLELDKQDKEYIKELL